jgi:hemoglobin
VTVQQGWQEMEGQSAGMEHPDTLYESAGGEQALHRLEELFYAKVLADPVLKAQLKARIPTHVDHLTWFTAESFGGPDRFSRELGFRHIIDEQRQRFA